MARVDALAIADHLGAPRRLTKFSANASRIGSKPRLTCPSTIRSGVDDAMPTATQTRYLWSANGMASHGADLPESRRRDARRTNGSIAES
jgi:hypothetical protein